MSEPGPAPDTLTDGRRARGERRRAELIAATLRVVERDGAGGVTHRSVAREAGAPTSLATYYFATLDDLLVAALTDVSRYYETSLRDVLGSGDDPLAGLASVLARSGTAEGRGRALAERELSTLAARRPALRGLARGWRGLVADVARTRTDDPDAAAALVAVSDGLCAAALLADDPPTAEQLLPVLRRAVGIGASPA